MQRSQPGPEDGAMLLDGAPQHGAPCHWAGQAPRNADPETRQGRPLPPSIAVGVRMATMVAQEALGAPQERPVGPRSEDGPAVATHFPTTRRRPAQPQPQAFFVFTV